MHNRQTYQLHDTTALRNTLSLSQDGWMDGECFMETRKCRLYHAWNSL